MVEQTAPPDAQLDAVFHALGDATRRRMLQSLAGGEQTVGQLAEPFQMSLAAASKHIKALESAGLIRRHVDGRTHRCSLVAGPLAAANDWLAHYEQFWQLRLDKLEDLLRQDSAAGAAAPNDTAPPPKARARRSPSPTTKQRSRP